MPHDKDFFADIDSRKVGGYDALQRQFDAIFASFSQRLGEHTPIKPGAADALPRFRAAYSDRTASLMAALASLAYNAFDTDGDRYQFIDDWTPDTPPKPIASAPQASWLAEKLFRGGFRLLAVYNSNTDLGDTQAFLAEHQDIAVLVFRGTTNMSDWKTNLSTRKSTLEGTRNRVKVHGGFYDAYKAIEAQVLDDVARVAHRLKDKPLYIAGHSLGGALASIASAALAPKLEDQLGHSTIAACYTFGSPRAGSKGFESWVKAPHYRVLNDADIVPTVPPFWLGYKHYGDVRFIHSDRKVPQSKVPLLRVMNLRRMLTGLVMLIFRRKFTAIGDHDIGYYARRLTQISQIRGQWD